MEQPTATALRGALDDLAEEVVSGKALALQPPLHVGQALQHRVDAARVDLAPQMP